MINQQQQQFDKHIEKIHQVILTRNNDIINNHNQ